MRIEVYNEKDEPEQVVRLKLAPHAYGVMLLSVDADGMQRAGILHVNEGGFIRCYDASRSGLPTDDKGRVLLVDE